MANRRMFSKSIIRTDRFVQLPSASQLLYFHLGIEADDDGFVASPLMIIDMLHCKLGDLETLCMRGFVIAFRSGVIVITEWKQHNYIQSDRYTPTLHKEEKRMLFEDENKVYRLVNGTESNMLSFSENIAK